MRDISFQSSKPKIIPGTEKPYKEPDIAHDQGIEIPSSWFNSRYGGHRVVKRCVFVLGDVSVKKYSSVETRRYGEVTFRKQTVTVVEDGTRWLAIERK
jgi:hypothetical protein